jgi:allophanate hydrolase subunit 1
MRTRYTFGGDEHLYDEMDEEMSLDAFFKGLSMSNAVREAQIPGVTEICPPTRASKSASTRRSPARSDAGPRARTRGEAERREKRLATRIIEIPVHYADPWTHETLMRFRERHQTLRDRPRLRRTRERLVLG